MSVLTHLTSEKARHKKITHLYVLGTKVRGNRKRRSYKLFRIDISFLRREWVAREALGSSLRNK